MNKNLILVFFVLINLVSLTNGQSNLALNQNYFRNCDPANDSSHCPYDGDTLVDEGHSFGSWDSGEMTDSQYGDYTLWNDNKWSIVWSQTTLSVYNLTIDLGDRYVISSVNSSYMRRDSIVVYLPTVVNYSCIDDSLTYIGQGSPLTIEGDGANQKTAYPLDFNNETCSKILMNVRSSPNSGVWEDELEVWGWGPVTTTTTTTTTTTSTTTSTTVAPTTTTTVAPTTTTTQPGGGFSNQNTTWFYTIMFGFIYFALWLGFRNLFIPTIYLLFVLWFFGGLLTTYALTYSYFTVLMSLAVLLYRTFSTRNTN